MFKKLFWALLEISTIGLGTYVFVSTMVNEDYVNHETAGLGAFLIVAGLLLRNWRTTLFVKEEKNETSKQNRQETQSKTGSALLILILALSFFGLNKKVNDIRSDVESNESELQSLDSQINGFSDIEERLENVESFEERIDDLETYSHSHY